MSKRSLFIPTKKIIIPTFLGIISLLLFLIIFFFLNSFSHTKKAITEVENFNFNKAAIHSQKAIKFPKLITAISFEKIDTIRAWSDVLETIIFLNEFESQINQLGDEVFSPNPQTNLIDLQDNLEELKSKLSSLKNSSSKSSFLDDSKYQEKIDKLNFAVEESLQILKTINQEPHSFLVLLQNTDEIRASGGFMGSYARIDLNEGIIDNLSIQDIYEPDGQFAGFVDAPPGAKEYLSGGEGLRLPDSNWHPDLPTSAKTISSYFAFGDERTIDSIITLNVEVIEKILKITGEIFLPDYGLTVTSDNLSALARADRNSFFAGSKQKVNFLSSLLDHLKIKATELSAEDHKNLANLFLVSLQNKDIQLFSWHQSLQNIFEDYNIAGEIEYREQIDYYLYLIESNVGINKANKKISREIDVKLGENRTDIEVKFSNDSTLSNLDYINYQRILLSPQTNITSIKYDNQTIEYYEEIITNSHGNQFKQVGFLLPIESGSNKILQITTNHQTLCQQQTCKIQIQKQSGLKPTPYQISYKNQSKNIILDKDEVITFLLR